VLLGEGWRAELDDRLGRRALRVVLIDPRGRRLPERVRAQRGRVFRDYQRFADLVYRLADDLVYRPADGAADGPADDLVYRPADDLVYRPAADLVYRPADGPADGPEGSPRPSGPGTIIGAAEIPPSSTTMRRTLGLSELGLSELAWGGNFTGPDGRWMVAHWDLGGFRGHGLYRKPELHRRPKRPTSGQP
jgi:hypothetical protein